MSPLHGSHGFDSYHGSVHSGPGGSLHGTPHHSDAYYGPHHGGTSGCEDVFCEEDPEQRVMDERWSYVGRGRGDYSQVTSMQPVGRGNGEFTREKVVVQSGLRVRLFCICSLCFMVLVVLGLLLFYLFGAPPPAADDASCANALMVQSQGLAPLCCQQGFTQFCAAAPTEAPKEKVLVHERYYTNVKTLKVPHVVQVPIPGPPPKVITHKVYVHTHAFDCEKDYNDWKHLWSGAHQRYCCYLKDIACRNKVEVRNHYHVVTRVKSVAVPERIPIPAGPPRVVTRVVNDPVQDPPQVIRVPTPGAPHVVKRIIHDKRLVPVRVPSPPQYHTVPVPVTVKDPGSVIPVKVPMPPQTVVHHKTIEMTRHIKVQKVYDCAAGFKNWIYGWSEAKKQWCCSHQERGCPGTWHGSGLTQTVTTGVTQHVGQQVYYTHSQASDYGHGVPDSIHTHHYVYHYGDADHGHSYEQYHSAGAQYYHGGYQHGSHVSASAGTATLHHTWHSRRHLDDEKSPFDCAEGKTNWQKWPKEKQDFCCTQGLCEK